MFRKIISCLLAMSMVVAMAGCSGQKQPVSATAEATTQAASESAATPVTEAEKTAEPKQEEAKQGGTRVVIDQNNDEITLPENIERVVITSPWPLPSVYCLFMGSGSKIVGIHPAVKAAAQHSKLMMVAPEIAEAETGFIQGGDLNIEELMKLEPDVVFYPAGNDAQKEAFQKANIPAVAFSVTIGKFNTIETVSLWVELLGEIFGDAVKSDEITAYGREVEAMIQDRLKDVPEEEKPRALILFKYSDTEFATIGQKHFGQYWLNATGAINVAGTEEGGNLPIEMEQVYEWDPDIIYVTNFSPRLPEDFYENTVPNHDWSGVKAVKEGNVMKYPLGMYRWYPPSSDSPLTLIWMAKCNHPELFADIDMDQEIKDYYKRFYNVDLTDQDVHDIMNPVREAADGV